MTEFGPSAVGGVSGRPRVLLVTQSLPYPPVSGDQQRTWFLHRALASIAEVDVMLMKRPGNPAIHDHCNVVATVEPTPRGRNGGWRLARPLAPRIIDRAATALGDRAVDYQPDPVVAQVFRRLISEKTYDLVVGRFIRPTALALPPGATPPPVVVDVDDVDFVRYQTWRARQGVDPLTRAIVGRHLRRVREVLPKVVRRFDHLWVASPRDLGLLDHPSVSVLPNLPYPAALGESVALPPASPDARVVLFVGIAAHRVNVEGVRRFAEIGWPIVRAHVPDAVFRVVGGGGWARRAPQLARTPGVELAGYVRDLSGAYRDAAFTVAPLFEGAGTKIKLLDSLASGRTIVAAAPAIRGFEHALHHPEHLFLGTDEEDLAHACVTLLRDPSRRDAMAAAGARAVAGHFTFDVFEKAVHSAVRDVINRRRASDGAASDARASAAQLKATAASRTSRG